MMKSEFENLAGREVTDEQYRAIETLYMSSNLEKTEFVKSMKPILKNIPQPEKKKDIKRMVVRDRSGYRKTPNGCYYHEVKVFYIEKWWGNRWDRINGLLMVGGEILAKMTPPYNLTGKDFEKVGITFASSGSGWQNTQNDNRYLEAHIWEY